MDAEPDLQREQKVENTQNNLRSKDNRESKMLGVFQAPLAYNYRASCNLSHSPGQEYTEEALAS